MGTGKFHFTLNQDTHSFSSTSTSRARPDLRGTELQLGKHRRAGAWHSQHGIIVYVNDHRIQVALIPDVSVPIVSHSKTLAGHADPQLGGMHQASSR
ncbi:hypothetical protein SAMN02746041_03104 [Desulfacinum hydrothermale DSM 13146]|uniref:Uncharacterized protein n=1 Tax=Desulfacinum hydrothermale DSM 13146 TaxID=1121390 RepID=A0A1W1XWF3_9BACT|nr:hypothetical protein SAMN02746041_03104 [Desulfacinum hydrothermale DSM 13146]